jgi:hypothetical protein
MTTVNGFTLLKSTFFSHKKDKGSKTHLQLIVVPMCDVFMWKQISAGVTRYLFRYLQISADICRYLADICSKAKLTMQSIVVVVVASALIVIIVA